MKVIFYITQILVVIFFIWAIFRQIKNIEYGPFDYYPVIDLVIIVGILEVILLFMNIAKLI